MFKCCSESKTLCLGCGCVILFWNMLSSFALFQFVSGLVLCTTTKAVSETALSSCPASFDSLYEAQRDNTSYRLQRHLLKLYAVRLNIALPTWICLCRQAAGSCRTRNPTLYYVILRELVLCFSDVNVLLMYIPNSQEKSLPSHSLCRRSRGKVMPQNDWSHFAEHTRADLIKLHVWKLKS